MKRKLFALLAILALFVGSACSDDDEPAVDAGDDTSQTTEAGKDDDGDAEKVAFKTDSRKFVDAPSTMKGGFVEVEVENTSKLVHEAAFVKVDGGKSQADVVKGIRAASQEQGAPIDPALHIYLAGNIGEIKPGATETAKVTLPAGEYYLLCALTDADSAEEEGPPSGEPPKLPTHMEEGMIQKVTVTGPSTVAAPTDAETSITAKEYSFDVKGLTPGKKEVLFVNSPAAKEIHMAAVMEFPEGVDEAAAKKAVEAFSGDGPPPAGTPEPEEAGFSGIFDPGGATYFDLDVKAGRVYAFLCFIQDRAGGPPHVAKGMVTLATVK